MTVLIQRRSGAFFGGLAAPISALKAHAEKVLFGRHERQLVGGEARREKAPAVLAQRSGAGGAGESYVLSR